MTLGIPAPSGASRPEVIPWPFTLTGAFGSQSVHCSKEFTLKAKKIGQFFSFNLCDAAWISESTVFRTPFAVIAT
jgi:hypothetical protein